MNRRSLLLSLTAALVLASPVWAGMEDDVVRQLRNQGFGEISVTRTLLGRVRVLGSRTDGTREIIFNPRTGEILRDLFVAASAGTAVVPVLRDDRDGAGGDQGGDDDDEDEDEDDHDDNSGHGGNGDD